jgi:mono/diheme cytochrome c family protein
MVDSSGRGLRPKGPVHGRSTKQGQSVCAIGWEIGGGSSSPASGSPATSQPSSPSSVSPAVAAGAHDFVQFGCGQCHRADGSGGISPYVPSLDTIGSSLTAAQLSTIIEHGAGVSANPTHPYMPIWRGIVSKHQIADLVTYIHAGLPAVEGATPVTVPTDQGLVVEGQAIYLRNGCVNCHGPNGPRPDRQHAAPGRDPLPGRARRAGCLPDHPAMRRHEAAGRRYR